MRDDRAECPICGEMVGTYHGRRTRITGPIPRSFCLHMKDGYACQGSYTRVSLESLLERSIEIAKEAKKSA